MWYFFAISYAILTVNECAHLVRLKISYNISKKISRVYCHLFTARSVYFQTTKFPSLFRECDNGRYKFFPNRFTAFKTLKFLKSSLFRAVLLNSHIVFGYAAASRFFFLSTSSIKPETVRIRLQFRYLNSKKNRLWCETKLTTDGL